MFPLDLVFPPYIPGDGVIHYLFQCVASVSIWFKQLIVFHEVFGLGNITMFDCLTSGTVAAAITHLFMPWTFMEEDLDSNFYDGEFLDND